MFFYFLFDFFLEALNELYELFLGPALFEVQGGLILRLYLPPNSEVDEF